MNSNAKCGIAYICRYSVERVIRKLNTIEACIFFVDQQNCSSNVVIYRNEFKLNRINVLCVCIVITFLHSAIFYNTRMPVLYTRYSPIRMSILRMHSSW